MKYGKKIIKLRVNEHQIDNTTCTSFLMLGLELRLARPDNLSGPAEQ